VTAGRRTPVGTLLLLAALLAAVVASMAIGDLPLSVGDVLRGLVDGEGEAGLVVRDLRLPRVAIAVLVGVGLAASGVIFQSLVRNPLATPDIIGVTGGAAVGAVALLTLVSASPLAVTGGALVGGMVAAAVVYTLSWRGGINGARLVLVGIGINAVCSALVTLLLIRAEITDATVASVWLTGSIGGAGWPEAARVATALAVLLPAALVLARGLDALSLGDDLAAGLGLPLERTRLGLLLVGVLLAAVVVSVAGPVGFVALVVPHVVRLLAGSASTARLLLLSAPAGALLLIVSDLAARRVIAPTILPVGIMTAVVGGPLFLHLLWRQRSRGS
jgi:iron complex transport system permease protein